MGSGLAHEIEQHRATPKWEGHHPLRQQHVNTNKITSQCLTFHERHYETQVTTACLLGGGGGICTQDTPSASYWDFTRTIMLGTVGYWLGWAFAVSIGLQQQCPIPPFGPWEPLVQTPV